MKVQPFLEANPYARAAPAAAVHQASAPRGASAGVAQPSRSQSSPLPGDAARAGHLSADAPPTTARVVAGGGRAVNELIRELTSVNVNPRHATAIDTFLNVAHYSGGDSIINVYA